MKMYASAYANRVNQWFGIGLLHYVVYAGVGLGIPCGGLVVPTPTEDKKFRTKIIA